MHVFSDIEYLRRLPAPIARMGDAHVPAIAATVVAMARGHEDIWRILEPVAVTVSAFVEVRNLAITVADRAATHLLATHPAELGSWRLGLGSNAHRALPQDSWRCKPKGNAYPDGSTQRWRIGALSTRSETVGNTSIAVRSSPASSFLIRWRSSHGIMLIRFTHQAIRHLRLAPPIPPSRLGLARRTELFFSPQTSDVR